MITLERDVFPRIGAMPMRQITPPDVLSLIRVLEARGAKETARRVRQRISAVCNFAIATARADNDPAAAIKTVMAPLKKGRQPAITDLDQAREILKRVEETPAPWRRRPVDDAGLDGGAW